MNNFIILRDLSAVGTSEPFGMRAGRARATAEIASFSNTFPQLSAPGVGILSAKAGGGLSALSGTSMACPHVAGVAALWWDALRKSALNASATAVMAKLLASARTNLFASDVDFADRGLGVVTAPTEIS